MVGAAVAVADSSAGRLVQPAVAVDSGDSFTTEKIRVRAGQRLRHVVKIKPGGSER